MIQRMLVNQEEVDNFSTKLYIQINTKSLYDKIRKRQKLYFPKFVN